MWTRRSARVGFGVSLVIGALGFGQPAGATMSNFKTFKQAYPDAKSVSCKMCHQNPIGKKGDLNPYGLALQTHKAPADAKSLTMDEIRAVEQEDADGDGASNLEEIKAGTLPGDPNSVQHLATQPGTKQ